MPRTDVTVPTGDGNCRATLHIPAEHGSWPAVILYPDAGGVRGVFATMADRLAALGYAVLLPDVYYRTPYAPFDSATIFSDPAEFQRLHALSMGVTGPLTVRDAGAFLAFLAGRPEVFGTAVGTTGYCMGGRQSLIAAGHYPDRIAAAASFHGGNLAAIDDPNSPHLLAHRIRATVYIAAAENDEHFPPEQHKRLEAALIAAKTPHTIETYPAAHGFAVPDNPTYERAADQRHWAALAELYSTCLRQAPPPC